MSEITEKTDTGHQLAGKYLTFMLGNEDYGIGILTVREIIGVMDITSVPNLPTYMKGVINLRGRVIPVLDLRLKFSMEPREYNARTCIVVVEVKKETATVPVGMVVDCVSEVMNFNADEIEPPPDLGGDVETSSILGMAKRNGQVKILLDIDHVVGSGDIVQIEKAA